MTETTNLHLKKPDSTDFYNVGDFNDNADIIDAAMSGKADRSEIPTSLPANGGNADTVDGKHAADFAEANHTHDDRYYTEAEANAQFAAKTDIPTSLPANGGNAATVGGISPTNLVRTLGWIADTDFLNNSAFFDYSYECNINATTASAIGLPAKFYIIKGFQFVNNGKYAVQIAYPRNHTGQALIRYANGTDWEAWKGLGDGCNAATVGGAAVVTSADLGLHRMSSGTAEATKSNCPVGCWYGQHE